jgi:hypothetical protein
MSQVLIVSYDLTNPGQNREALVKKIKAYSIWARLGRSTYLIKTDATPVQVRDELKQVLDTNDRVFVGVAPPPSAWVGMPEDVSKWILKNQKAG